MLRRKFLPLLVGAGSVPAIVMLHEFGHFGAGVAVGLHPRLTYSSVVLYGAPESLVRWETAVTAAGPCVELLLFAIGLFWLRASRFRRLSSVPTPVDWLGTGFALASGRWLRCFTGKPANPKPEDEALLSQALGLPSYVLPYVMVVPAIFGIVYTIRLHPKSMRLIPFLLWSAGGLAGLVAWFYLIGPFLLPRA